MSDVILPTYRSKEGHAARHSNGNQTRFSESPREYDNHRSKKTYIHTIKDNVPMEKVVSYEGMVMEWRLDDAKALSPILVTVVVRHTLAIL
jgi:hypothetical protein